MSGRATGFVAQIARLARHSAIYAISTALQKLPGLLLMPIYTSFDYIPSFADYADVVTLYTFAAFMNFVYVYGMDSALMRYFFLGGKDRRTVFSSVFYVLIGTSLVATLLLTAGAEPLAGALLYDADKAHLVRLLAFVLLFDALGNLPYLILRAEERPLPFTAFKGLRFVLELGFNVLFVVGMKLEVAGILYTSLVVSILNFLIMLPVMWRYLGARLDMDLWREMVAFALPLLPHGVAFTTTEMIDRFLIPALLDKDALAVYGASYKFGSVLLMIILAFRNAWQPFFLKAADRPDARELYGRVLTYFVLGAGMVIAVGTLFIEDVLTFSWFGWSPLIQEPYWGGIPIIPVILLSYGFYGIYLILTPGFYIRKKSMYMILFTGSAALANIAANLILLPLLNSYWGAAWATLIAYAVMALTILLVNRRIYPIPIDGRRLAAVALVVCGAFLIQYGWSPGLPVRLAAGALIPVIAWRGLLTAGERTVLTGVIRRRLGRGTPT